MSNTNSLLLYFADPMCSWCWGFSPVIESIRETCHDRMKVALILGGLHPGQRLPMTPAGREEILHHWHSVAEQTHQPFQFEGALPAGFVYDTEPASRAVMAVAAVNPEATFSMFKAIQAGFYAQGLDVTQPATLAGLAAEQGVPAAEFMALFESDAVRGKTQAHFALARRMGVSAFPTLMVQQGERHGVLCRGYHGLDVLLPRLEALLR